VNEKIKLKLLDFVRYSTLNARCLYGCIIEMELNRELGSGNLSELKAEIQSKLLTEFNHFNLLYLLFIEGNDNAVSEYLTKNRNQVNGDVLGVAVVENCALISDIRIGILLDTFHDSPSVILACSLQSLRKSPQETSILNRLKAFGETKLKNTEIFKMYTEEASRMLKVS